MHYILVQVRDSRDIGPVRKAIHDTHVDEGDIVLRSDRTINYYGLDIKEDLGVLHKMFERHMSRARELSEIRPTL